MENKIEFQDFTYSADDVYKENPSEEKILKFLAYLRDSHHSQRDIFTQGSCFYLFLILNSLFLAAEAWYSDMDGHYIVKLEDNYYDIGGKIDSNYIEGRKYKKVTNVKQLESSKLHKYGDKTGVSYSKYLKTI